MASWRGRAVPWWLLSIAVLAVAAAIVVPLTVSQPANTRGKASPLEPTTTGNLIRFKLPYLRDSVKDPNARDVAQHGAADAPLLLFLPATGAVPSDYQNYLATAVSEGYSVLGLDYWNIGRSVTRTCGPHPRCYTMLQRNRFDGSRPSRFSRVTVANSILTRYRAAIAYLGKHDPQGHWDRYLDGDQPAWNNIVLSGHSQGGGESAFISHYHHVRGVLMFSSPVETFQDVSASWINGKGKTPVADMYGFDSINDMYYDRIVDTWRRLGMGRASKANAVAVPMGGHVLLTSYDLGNGHASHGREIGDGGPRNNDDTPVFQPTWKWMLQQVR